MMERLHQETAAQASSDGVNGALLLELTASCPYVFQLEQWTIARKYSTIPTKRGIANVKSASGIHLISKLFAVVAFTGGNGPALTAYLLNNLFDGSVVGCIGNPLSMQPQQVEHARFVADLLGDPPQPPTQL